MSLFIDLSSRVASMRALIGDVDDAQMLPEAVGRLDDAAALGLLEAASGLAERVRIAAAGVVAQRSSRVAGHSGLAQRHGHRNAVSLIQHLTGSTRADAAKQARVGESLFTAEEPARTDDEEGADQSEASASPAIPWRALMQRALLDGSITASQHDAITRGLGAPPAPRDAEDGLRLGEAWTSAAERLLEEAPHRTVEELALTARALRDRLDPEGAETRFLVRHEARSFRLYTDREGVKRASIACDDEGGAWLSTVINMALRPRRGGPRFVDPEEQTRATGLADDPRTNDQLAYDLVFDLLRAGALADAATVFGTRQAGLRLVRVIEPEGDGLRHGVAHTEDEGLTLPSSVADRHVCGTGVVPVKVDPRGNPLDVGREQRLYTAKQRIALAIRDGGCRWHGCDRPASYCEAHHIDEWVADRGRTDIDRGILLCRFHHMQLHHGKWRITRQAVGDFVLHDASGHTRRLAPRAALTAAWAGVEPPPPRFRPHTPEDHPSEGRSPGKRAPGYRAPGDRPPGDRPPGGRPSEKRPPGSRSLATLVPDAQPPGLRSAPHR